MAKYTITHSCGHSVKKDLRPSEVAYMTKKIEASKCFECQCAEKSAQATEMAQSQGLPTLTGTDAQISFAQTKRIELIEKIKAHIATYEDVSDEQKAAVIAVISAKTDSAYWLNIRGLDEAIEAAATEAGILGSAE